MKLRPVLLRSALFALAALPPLAAAERLILNFNPDWRFLKADPAGLPSGAAAKEGAAAPAFDDSAWKPVSAPHTYNDEDTFDDWSIPGHVGEQNQWSGRTWYRKTFTAPEAWHGRKVFIEFEAVRQVAEVYLNGEKLGVCKTGFTPFGFDLTPHLRFGAPNVLVVMCDNRFMRDPLGRQEGGARPAGASRNDLNVAPPPSASLGQMLTKMEEGIPEEVDALQADQIPWNNPHWHPAHGGLYRNVRLHVTDPLHIELPLYSFLQAAGPYAYATNISAASAQVGIEVPVKNDRAAPAAVEVRAEVFDADGQSVLVLNQSQSLAAGARADFKLAGALPHPRLWEPAYPHVYRVVCAVRVDGATVDTTEIPLGLRSVRWDTNAGFFINGHHLKLHGWGQKPTDEWPGLGAAQPDWMHFYTLNLMKQAGGNFVRWGHAATGPAMIAAADRLGLVTLQPGVDGEADTRGAAWKLRAAAFRDMVIYFRNHPSILIYEGGNQKVTREHARELRGYMDTYDPHGGRAYAHRRADQITAEFMNVGVGTEGGREIKALPVVEGEYNREESPRRVWDDASPPNFGYPEAKGMTYQLTSEQFAANEVAHYVKKLGAENHSGGANWIFSDSTSGGRVPAEVARASGEVDGGRLPKEAYYVCAAMFRADPQVHLIGHWTYPAGTKKPVYVASNGDAVELFVNGKSLGRGKQSDRYLFTFADVAWEAGEIKAVASVGGKPIATQTKHTIGAPVALRLTSLAGPGGLRADGADVALIDVEAVDASGERCPTFQQRVDFAVEGPGVWRGGYNSGKIKSTNNTWLDLECGLNRVAVRATRAAGAITVRAKCAGLKPGSVTIEAKPFAADGGFSTSLPAVPAVQLPTAPTAAAASQISNPKSEIRNAASSARFISSFNYTGPTAGAHVESDAQDGKKIYADRAYAFAGLPADLRGADWICTVDGDARYSAVDLMEIAVKGGTVVTHHALVSYQRWPDYERIIGGRYPETGPKSGVVTPQVGYEHDVDLPVVIAARKHPITAGVPDFTIHDEIYWGFRVGADVTPLLTTTHPKSGKPLAWCRTEGQSRLVYLMLGHDGAAYANPNYRRLLANAIRWTARR